MDDRIDAISETALCQGNSFTAHHHAGNIMIHYIKTENMHAE